ncbi:hypothetical protein LCGC14_0860010 [marine sediment metagenome]|uniref:DUF3782 domain-containing protein n=1 Tax=marine sediment metagenome TaxID=412755 RepID=A0A0F9PT28_9ZZZZ
MEKEEFLRLLPKLIREDDEVKGAIITALSGVVATKDDITRIIDHSDRRFEAIDKRFEAIDKRFEDLIGQIGKGFEDAKRERMIIDSKIEAISSRGSESLEKTILYLLNDKLIQENIQTAKIKKEELLYREGTIFWENYNTDIDVLIQNGKTILIEVKYHPDNRDGFHLLKNARLYKLQFKKDYDNLMIICLEIKRINLEQIEKQGIKVIAGKVIE